MAYVGAEYGYKYGADKIPLGGKNCGNTKNYV